MQLHPQFTHLFSKMFKKLEKDCCILVFYCGRFNLQSSSIIKYSFCHSFIITSSTALILLLFTFSLQQYMSITASNDTWTVGNLKMRVQLNEENTLLVQINDQQSKETWITKEIDELGASKIIEGLWEDPVVTLADMIKDGFNKASGILYSISFKVYIITYSFFSKNLILIVY